MVNNQIYSSPMFVDQLPLEVAVDIMDHVYHGYGYQPHEEYAFNYRNYDNCIVRKINWLAFINKPMYALVSFYRDRVFRNRIEQPIFSCIKLLKSYEKINPIVLTKYFSASYREDLSIKELQQVHFEIEQNVSLWFEEIEKLSKEELAQFVISQEFLHTPFSEGQLLSLVRLYCHEEIKAYHLENSTNFYRVLLLLIRFIHTEQPVENGKTIEELQSFISAVIRNFAQTRRLFRILLDLISEKDATLANQFIHLLIEGEYREGLFTEGLKTLHPEERIEFITSEEFLYLYPEGLIECVTNKEFLDVPLSNIRLLKILYLFFIRLKTKIIYKPLQAEVLKYLDMIETGDLPKNSNYNQELVNYKINRYLFKYMVILILQKTIQNYDKNLQYFTAVLIQKFHKFINYTPKIDDSLFDQEKCNCREIRKLLPEKTMFEFGHTTGKEYKIKGFLIDRLFKEKDKKHTYKLAAYILMNAFTEEDEICFLFNTCIDLKKRQSQCLLF